MKTVTRVSLALLLILYMTGPGRADSSSPLLAAYYDRQMAIVGGATYAWKGNDAPERIDIDAVQVGVGRDAYYALDRSGKLLSWRSLALRPATIMRGVGSFSAGRSSLLVITKDGALWRINPLSKGRTRIAENVAQAAVGDGTDYYVTGAGDLFVRGKAHRGQYGDGKLTSTDGFVRTASKAAWISAHTGHAILLTTDGDVLGTGGNIYGPVGKHGLGDKADRWSRIMSGARAVATGSLHTVAIRRDGMLLAWGDGYGAEPAPVMSDVVAAAAGSATTTAIRRDGSLWQWKRGEAPMRLRLTQSLPVHRRR